MKCNVKYLQVGTSSMSVGLGSKSTCRWQTDKRYFGYFMSNTSADAGQTKDTLVGHSNSWMCVHLAFLGLKKCAPLALSASGHCMMSALVGTKKVLDTIPVSNGYCLGLVMSPKVGLTSSL